MLYLNIDLQTHAIVIHVYTAIEMASRSWRIFDINVP